MEVMGWRKIPFPYCKQVVYNEIQKILALAIALLRIVHI